MEEYGKEWLKDLEAIDCKYFIIKAEDLFEALNENMLREFSDMLYYYNEYREQQGKSINKYFVLNRDEYPQFKTFEEFKSFIDNKNKTKWEYRVVSKPMSVSKLNELGEEGWELVNYDNDTRAYHFKRLKQ
jgi:hypothetical protein|nr:MAG TPA: protein of unknown function (DUF4177) [Bacteriophage sp.]